MDGQPRQCETTPLDEFDTPPDGPAVERLERLTTSPEWPDAWLTLDELAAELAARGFWTGPLAVPSAAGRCAWLRNVFGSCRTADMDPRWEELDGRFRHASTISDPRDHCRLANAAQAKMNARFGLDEPLPYQPM